MTLERQAKFPVILKHVIRDCPWGHSSLSSNGLFRLAHRVINPWHLHACVIRLCSQLFLYPNPSYLCLLCTGAPFPPPFTALSSAFPVHGFHFPTSSNFVIYKRTYCGTHAHTILDLHSVWKRKRSMIVFLSPTDFTSHDNFRFHLVSCRSHDFILFNRL